MEVIKFAESARYLPEYQTQGAAGADVRASIEKDIVIDPGEYMMVPTGLFAEIPSGYEIQVRPRSGLAAKHGVTVLNSPGTIDSDYRGEIKVLLINHGKHSFTVKDGDRIAEFVVAKVCTVRFELGEIGATDRGEGGFGHTGRQ